MNAIRSVTSICTRHVTLLRAAVFLLIPFAIVHLLGWRDDTAIISGTISPRNAEWMILRGVIYGMLYFCAVIVAPILILASGIKIVLVRSIFKVNTHRSAGASGDER